MPNTAHGLLDRLHELMPASCLTHKSARARTHTHTHTCTAPPRERAGSHSLGDAGPSTTTDGTRTHTHSHTHTHACTHIHAHAHGHMPRAHTDTHTHAHTQILEFLQENGRDLASWAVVDDEDVVGEREGMMLQVGGVCSHAGGLRCWLESERACVGGGGCWWGEAPMSGGSCASCCSLWVQTTCGLPPSHPHTLQHIHAYTNMRTQTLAGTRPAVCAHG